MRVWLWIPQPISVSSPESAGSILPCDSLFQRLARSEAAVPDGLTPHQRYYRKNKAKNAAKVKKWLQEHPGANAAACRRHYQKSAESQREKAKRRYETVIKPFKRTEEGKLKEHIKAENRRNKLNGRVTAEEWQEILRLHGNRCFYCGSGGPLEMDHVTAVTKGGRHDKSNIVPACKPCNSSKGNRHMFPPRLRRSE